MPATACGPMVIGGIPEKPKPGSEAEMRRDRRHGHQAGRGVHLHAAYAVLHRIGMVAAIHVRHSQPVVEEADVELALLQHAGDVLVVFRRISVRPRVRVPPRSGQGGAILRLQESDEVDLAHFADSLQPSDIGGRRLMRTDAVSYNP
jgi:hypothetical protein